MVKNPITRMSSQVGLKPLVLAGHI